MPKIEYVEFKKKFKNLDDHNEYGLYKSTYDGTTKKMKFKHRVCGNIFYMTPKNFINGQRCPECARLKRINANIIPIAEDDKNFLIKNNFKLINWNGCTKKSKFKCMKCNYEFEMTINQLKNTLSCPNCSISKVNKINCNISKYNKKLEEVGFEIIPEYFHGTLKKSKFKCLKCGKIQNGYYYNILYQSYRCECSKCKSHIDIDYYKEKLKELKLDKEYYMYEDTYINSKTKMKFKHLKCGNIFWKTPTDFFSNNQHCKYCTNLGSITPEILNDLLIENNLSLVSSINQNISKKKLFKVKCILCNNVFTTSVRYIIANGNTCGCNRSSNGEISIENYLNDKNIRYIKEKKFKDLVYKGQLRLDFYLPDFNIAIEYDGIQHYKRIDWFEKDISFEEIRNRDSAKNKFCYDKGISLIRIPYFNYDQIDIILDHYLYNV